MYKSIAFIVTVICALTILASPCFSIENDPQGGTYSQTMTGSSSSSPKVALNENESIMIQSSHSMQGIFDQKNSYFVQAGAVLPISDSDFRDFVDYGASITVGVEKEITSKLSLMPTIGLLLLNGDWNMAQERSSLVSNVGSYVPNYPDEATTEDISDINQGVSYSEQGGLTMLNAELLQQIDLETSLYILPVSLNLVYQLHQGGKKINPYIGGGLGVCVAWREVESRTLKQKYYSGPVYNLTFNDNQTVTGELAQLFGGIDVPFHGNMKFVANVGATFYDLRNFKPILEISASNPTPSSYQGPSPQTFSYEDSVEIGVFGQEIVTSASIGIVVAF